MSKRKVLIVDSSEDFQQSLLEALKNDYHVKQCCDGKEGLAAVLSFRPDILVLDLMIPNLDGLSLLQAAHSAGVAPTVITVTKLYNDYMLHSLARLNVDYVMLKPCEMDAVVGRIHDLELQGSMTGSIGADISAQANELLLELGFLAKHRGFAYLREAIVCYNTNPRQSVTKELYPAIAAALHVKKTCVERSIRTAIEAAWLRGDPAAWAQFFPVDPGFPAARPTNSHLIARLASELHHNR